MGTIIVWPNSTKKISPYCQPISPIGSHLPFKSFELKLQIFDYSNKSKSQKKTQKMIPKKLAKIAKYHILVKFVVN